jgi:hypothetical protein
MLVVYKKILSIVTFLLLTFVKTEAQETTTTSGGDASGIGGTNAYSIGQVIYTTNSSSSGSVSQGVQQAYEIYSAIIKETDLNISISTFPNPTTAHLTLQITDFNNEDLSYFLYDVQGKLLSNAPIKSELTEIKTARLSAASYFLYVVNQNNEKIQSFKIIKK